MGQLMWLCVLSGTNAQLGLAGTGSDLVRGIWSMHEAGLVQGQIWDAPMGQSHTGSSYELTRCHSSGPEGRKVGHCWASLSLEKECDNL